jgi:hypothetical protein
MRALLPHCLSFDLIAESTGGKLADLHYCTSAWN